MSGERPTQIYTDSSHLFCRHLRVCSDTPRYSYNVCAEKFKDKRRRNIPSQNELFGKQEPDGNARVYFPLFAQRFQRAQDKASNKSAGFLKNTETLLKNGKNDFFSQRFYPRSACDGENRPLSPILPPFGDI